MTHRTSRIAVAAAMAAGVAVAVATPVSADVTVTVTVDKIKDIVVIETITKTKTVLWDTDTLIIFEGAGGAAEAQALANVLNEDNFVDLDGVSYESRMSSAVVLNTGVTQVSQASGNMHNQGNLLAAAVTAAGAAFVNAQAEVEQENLNGQIPSVVTGSSFLATMTASVTDNIGVTQVNQDSGNMNNQTNAVAVAAGIETDGTDVLAALAESALGQTSSNHEVEQSDNIKDAQMIASVIGNDGITHVNQAVGMYANQANVVSIGTAVVNF